MWSNLVDFDHKIGIRQNSIFKFEVWKSKNWNLNELEQNRPSLMYCQFKLFFFWTRTNCSHNCRPIRTCTTAITEQNSVEIQSHFFVVFSTSNVKCNVDINNKSDNLIFKGQKPYSQNFFTQIRKIFVTLTWILELISHQK